MPSSCRGRFSYTIASPHNGSGGNRHGGHGHGNEFYMYKTNARSSAY
jgi:hypothetical protein